MSDEKFVKKRVGGSKDRPWIPRMWSGMTVKGWGSVLARGHYKVHPKRWAMAGILCGLSGFNSVLTAIQSATINRKSRDTQLVAPPVFIIGHWRSGTTLLHEYLVRDSQFTYPDTYTCFAPNHFLLSQKWIRPCTEWLLPAKCPIDNMQVGWGRPQEDEFAICNMGLPSPYLMLTFPNQEPCFQEYLDIQGAPEEGQIAWRKRFNAFLKDVTYANNRRIVLKSPTHTARVGFLAHMFPGAKFIHIHRNPYDLFPSTVHLWMRLAADQGLQVPKGRGIEEYVLSTFEKMYEAFRRDRECLAPNQLATVSYSDLAHNPVREIERIYGELELEGFDEAKSTLVDFAESQKDYRKNHFEIAPEIRSEIAKRWRWYMEEFGYGDPKAECPDSEESEAAAAEGASFSPV